VLARANRIVRGIDFRATMRGGRRTGSATAVVYVRTRSDASPSRFGFVVSKAVGDSVRRHLVTRRLRAIAREALPTTSTGVDVVVRALPGSAEAGWASLHDDVWRGIERGTR
jgi:ribonuclease P protein component